MKLDAAKTSVNAAVWILRSSSVVAIVDRARALPRSQGVSLGQANDAGLGHGQHLPRRRRRGLHRRLSWPIWSRAHLTGDGSHLLNGEDYRTTNDLPCNTQVTAPASLTYSLADVLVACFF